MGKNKVSRYTRSGLKKALAAGVSLGVMGSIAFAQVSTPEAPLKLRTDYLGYAAAVSPRVGYSDNINLASDGFEDDEFILSTLFSGGAIASTPRVTAIILGDLDFSYLIDRNDFRVNQNIGATSTFTLSENLLYFDLSGTTARQLVGDNARYSSNLNAARGQRANVHSYSASPYIYRRFADQSSIELRYRFSQVFIDDGGNVNTFGGVSLDDSTSHEALASYESGALFDRLRFRLTAYGNDTTENTRNFILDTGMGPQVYSGFDYQQGSAMAEAELALSDKFSLSGAVGYDEIDPQDAAALFFDEDDLTGVFWRGGFTLNPGRRSRIRLEYGQRYDDEFIDADIFYELSSRLIFTAGANRSFRTRAQSISSQVRSTQRLTLDFADSLREGEELSARGVIDAANFVAKGLGTGVTQTTGVSVSDSAFASLNGRFGRTEATVSGFYSDDDYGYRTVESYGVAFNARRQLSRRLSAYGNVNYRHADTTVDTTTCLASPGIFGFDVTDPAFDAMVSCALLAVNNGVTNTVIGRIGASYRLYEHASAFGEYSRSERFSSNSQLEYSENAVLVGITLDF